tara:strand:+ start:456 stop:806 length:351 start_codon:yes stop_codon:yes gene_type:complete
MAINKYAYFAVGSGANAAGEAVMVPVDNFTGAEISLDDTLTVNFKRVTSAFASDASIFSLEHDTGASRECMEQVAAAFSSNPKDGFISIADVDKDGHGRFFAETGANVIIDCTFSL